MEFVQTKTILSTVKPTDQWIYRDYNMNIYRGCSHGCIYCDSRSLCYQIEQFDIVRAKKDAIDILREELKRKRRKGIVASGAMSDPYNPYERKYKLTRNALEALLENGFGSSITTKSSLITRDIDLLKEINKASGAFVHMTITTADDDLSKIIEPHVNISSERFEALDRLSNAGIYTGILIMPVLPYLTDSQENIAAIVRRAAMSGVKNIICFPGMTLRAGNREYFYTAIDRYFPELKAKYRKQYGDRYQCVSTYAKGIYNKFRLLCETYGIVHDFHTLNRQMRTMKPRPVTQLNLF